jgi:small subunit ribosomal protein S6
MAVEKQIDTKRASDYETVFILRPDIDAEGSEKVISRVVSSIEGSHGRLTKVESWGKRRLAYPISMPMPLGQQRKGVYVYVRYLGFQGSVSEVERGLRMADSVMRYLTVRVGHDIDVSSVVVDPEEIKVRRIEITTDEDDRDESFEAQLGLSDDHPPRREYTEAPAASVEPEVADKPVGDA